MNLIHWLRLSWQPVVVVAGGVLTIIEGRVKWAKKERANQQPVLLDE